MHTQKNTFFCFSPFVMFSTFLIEIASAIYIMFRYQMDTTAKLVTILLANLAIFQLAEYMVCEGAFYISSLDWARLGYAAITILPPLALHIGLQITQKKNTVLQSAAYGSAAIFMCFFLFVGHGMQAQQCLGNYVIFEIAPYAVIPYTIYYYGWLFIGVSLAWRVHDTQIEDKRKKALVWLTIGYLSFMIPTILVNIINPETVSGIPSIMCGFAIIMALILTVKVSPLVLHEKDTNKQTATSKNT